MNNSGDHQRGERAIRENVLRFNLERTDEKLTPHAGLAVAHEFHGGLGVREVPDDQLPAPGSNREYAASEVIRHYKRRGTADNYSKGGKHGFGMPGVPCGEQDANAA
ncbi:MAG: hypothetical protein ACOC70_00180 [bacterium]